MYTVKTKKHRFPFIIISTIVPNHTRTHVTERSPQNTSLRNWRSWAKTKELGRGQKKRNIDFFRSRIRPPATQATKYRRSALFFNAWKFGKKHSCGTYFLLLGIFGAIFHPVSSSSCGKK